ncbi:MAG: rod shape-determining protein MreD [Candidatus Cloacimonas sp. 4484_143]|nr:MAG: rod shape-determining protein MreD [Candidatus Cloacimonas sp. 4484_143]
MRFIKYVLLGIFTFYFQLLAAHHFALFSIIPNFFIPFFAFVSIQIKSKLLFPLAFFLGIALDIMYPLLLGLNTITFLIISFIVNKFHMNVNKQRFIIVGLSILFLNFIYYSFLYIYHILVTQLMDGFFHIYLFSLFYNTFISILCSWVVDVISRGSEFF